MQQSAPSSWRRFLRLWFVLGFAYFFLKFLFNIAVMGWIDVRPSAFLEILVLPFGQTMVLWVVTRRARTAAGSPPASARTAADS